MVDTVLSASALIRLPVNHESHQRERFDAMKHRTGVYHPAAYVEGSGWWILMVARGASRSCRGGVGATEVITKEIDRKSLTIVDEKKR